jgi:hypothetical protein
MNISGPFSPAAAQRPSYRPHRAPIAALEWSIRVAPKVKFANC